MVYDFFRNLIRNIVRVFTGKNLWWHMLAIALTIALVVSGADWWFYVRTRSTAYYPLVWFAGIGGFIVPVIVPLCMYLLGDLRRNKHWKRLGVAMGQAELIALLVTSFYKAFTGRTAPPFLGPASALDISKQFHFGFFENGIFWGWPSSHAAVAFAGMVALMLLVRHKAWAIVFLIYALAIASGAAIGFHWFSDVVAGTIIGILVGGIVAKSFARQA